MPNTIKVFRVAKSNNVYQGPIVSSGLNAWELDENVMALDYLLPDAGKEHWLYGFTEIQMQMVISKKLLKALVASGYSLYVFELPVESVDVFHDQVCFDPIVMDNIYMYEYDKVA